MNKCLIMTMLALTACAAEAPLSMQVVESEMARCPQASYLDGQDGKLKWNYTTGLELKAFLDAWESSGDVKDELIPRYVDEWYDAIIADDGRIGANYKRSNFSSDHICPGRTLFRLYELTGKEKYRAAMDSLYSQIQGMPRTPEGGFWHKRIYPQQMWLDGLYMVEPFYAEYTSRYVEDELLREANWKNIALQFRLSWQKCLDPATGLPRHAWDSSREMFWADNQTGQSAHAWGRACGWYAMALVEVIPLMPSGDLRDELTGILRQLMVNIMDYADPETGMWYQVLDQPGREGNWLESTCSAMFTYVLLKACSNGWIEEISVDTAKQKFDRLVDTFVRTGNDSLVNLTDCCEVAGLGGKENRRGDYEYYIHERVRANDPKGIGPLIWASIEYEKL